MYTIGFDIGTTTVSAAVVEPDGRILRKACNLPNDGTVDCGKSEEKVQLPEKIEQEVMTLLEQLLREFPEPQGIGLTGQMHGILYVGADGAAVSPLYTWQDRRAERRLPNGETVSGQLSALAGMRIPAGYGLATHYSLLLSREIPKRAVSFCTIADYIGMRLTGRARPLVHVSNAASLGGFDLRRFCFESAALECAGLDAGLLPEVSDREVCIGEFRGIPVRIAIGDNQASFLGAAGWEEGSLLVNIGTGSQVSAVSPKFVRLERCELRPFIGGSYLAVGAAQCGGRAYAMLADFFRSFAQEIGAQDTDIYCVMNRLAEQAACPPEVDTCFAGTAAHPERRGSIGNIGISNFTPANLCAGFLRGMANELYEFYQEIRDNGCICSQMIASGNGARKNPVLRRILSETFGMQCQLSPLAEEAACGAALLA